MTGGVLDGRGAVVGGFGGPVRVESIRIDPPGPGEVRVRLEASGVCHSDHWAVEHGNWGDPFPMLLGHEGAGTVIDVGEEVDTVAPDDRVVLAWGVPCGGCRACRRGAPRTCSHAWVQPPRLSVRRTGEPLVGTLSLGTLSTHTVVHADQVIPVPAGVALSRVCLLGCGVSTGLGASLNTAKVWAGSTVAVVGLGGIGLSALQGARLAGAERLIAIDLAPAKLAWAAALGATDTVDASARDPVAAVRDLTRDRGVDFAFEATGVADVVGSVVAMLGRGGVAVAIGVPQPDRAVSINWSAGRGAAYPNKASLLITDGGDALRDDFTVWLRQAAEGSLDLDAMVSVEAPFSEASIDEAFRAMLAGEVVRTVIRIDG